MSEPYTLDTNLYPDITHIVTEDDTSKHDFSSDIDDRSIISTRAERAEQAELQLKQER